jgi:hypothetical protein
LLKINRRENEKETVKKKRYTMGGWGEDISTIIPIDLHSVESRKPTYSKLDQRGQNKNNSLEINV